MLERLGMIPLRANQPRQRAAQIFLARAQALDERREIMPWSPVEFAPGAVVDVDAVARLRGDAARRGVGLLEEALLLEVGHRVPDGGGAELLGALAREAPRRDRLARRDVLFDDRNMEPRWAVVKIPGLLGGEHFMPVDNSYVDEDGNLIVPWNKDIVKKAPKPGGDHVMTPEVASELREYYGAAA